MPIWTRKYLPLFLSAVLIMTVCLVDGFAQTKKKKRPRRASKPAAAKPVITNPTIAPPTETAAAGDVKIISTADSTTEGDVATPEAKKPKTATTADQENMQQTITTLSNQVNRLADKLGQMQDDDRYMVDMERLTRAEQRAEQVRSQLIDTQGKIADAQAKLEGIEYALKPENIDRVTQGYGTVHPEEAREARRRQLESEKTRTQAQLALLETGRVRQETALATADNEVDLLRAKLNQRREQMDVSPTPVNPDARPRKP